MTVSAANSKSVKHKSEAWCHQFPPQSNTMRVQVCNLNHTFYALIGSGLQPEPAGGLGVNGAQEEERGDLGVCLTRTDFEKYQ